MEVGAEIGGCFRSHECQCGAAFCHGEMLRRLDAGMPLGSDCHFFVENKNGALCVNVGLIESANAKYRQLFHDVDPRSMSMEGMRMRVIETMGNGLHGYVRMSAVSLLDKFFRHVWKKTKLPVDLQEMV